MTNRAYKKRGKAKERECRRVKWEKDAQASFASFEEWLGLAQDLHGLKSAFGQPTTVLAGIPDIEASFGIGAYVLHCF